MDYVKVLLVFGIFLLLSLNATLLFILSSRTTQPTIEGGDLQGNGSFEYVPLNDNRVIKYIRGEFHHGACFANVYLFTGHWSMLSGDYAAIDIENVNMVGIVYERAEHHFDAMIYLDGEPYYGTSSHHPYFLSGYMPATDEYGCVHWITVPPGKHQVMVKVLSSHNRMIDVTGLASDHFCLSGFILMKGYNLPPPVYGSWCFKKTETEEESMGITYTSAFIDKTWKQEEISTDYLFTTMDAWEARKLGKPFHAPDGYVYRGTFDNVIPPKGYLYIMDLFGQGSLDFISVKTDGRVRLDVIDGYPDSLVACWSRQIYIPPSDKDMDLFTSLMTFKTENGTYLVKSSEKIDFASRLVIRLFNPSDEPRHLLGVYMEGRLRLI